MDKNSEQRIAALKNAGKYPEAATLLEQQGKFREAAALLAGVWDFVGALAIAQPAACFVDAYRYAIEASRFEDAIAIREALAHASSTNELRDLARFADGRGRHEDAAYFALWGDDDDFAAELFERAGHPLLAAKILLRRGRAEQAVTVLGRALRLEHTPQLALGLGRLLLSLERYEKSIEILQSVPIPAEHQGDAERLLAKAFRATGLEGAAARLESHFSSAGSKFASAFRFVPLAKPGAVHDRFLDRGLIEESNPGLSRITQLKEFAQVVHPGLQMVMDMSEERALLLAASGTVLQEAIETNSPWLKRPRPLSLAEAALDRLHALGVAHGEIDTDHFYLTPYASVLLLPSNPAPSASIKQDQQAFKRVQLAL